MKTQIRIVAGSLRGRKLTCNVNPGLRPAPQMVREALFSILGNAVPARPFFDLFAGTGAIGLEALSRGASHVTFVERDYRIALEIERHLLVFGVSERARVDRADVYRWAERWPGSPEPVSIFLGPPYPDFERCPDALLGLIGHVQTTALPDSVLVLQCEKTPVVDELPDRARWETRRYGRNMLLIWVKE
jgi:16S rRNA (guanine(966)-N(2))-methyltransferase RsmD